VAAAASRSARARVLRPLLAAAVACFLSPLALAADPVPRAGDSGPLPLLSSPYPEPSPSASTAPSAAPKTTSFPVGSYAPSTILDTSSLALRVQSISTRVSAFDQFGHGYQSQAGPVLGPGSERVTVLEGQTEIIATQGDRVTHRLWIPVDVVTAASPDAIDQTRASADVVSGASRKVVSGTLDWTVGYKVDAATDLSMRNALHLEEPLRSWSSGLAARRSFADENTVVSANVIESFDWFDHFDITGHRHGHGNRSGTTGSVGLTQVLTPTTLANVNYGVTVLAGTLGNTWNSVPLASGTRGPEILPLGRVRHAVVGRASQFLPWNGALRGYYRFYADDWGIVAHSIEGQLMQRLSPFLYIGALYRFHTQTGATFFTTLAVDNGDLRVADSDLAPLQSQTIGGRVVADFPLAGDLRALHCELGYERYVRTNDLRMNIVTWATGFRF
jgi:hypothetical protein